MLCMCVCVFLLRRESPDRSWGDEPLIFEVVLSQEIGQDPDLSDYNRTSSMGIQISMVISFNELVLFETGQVR
jgi:hypothetical protein